MRVLVVAAHPDDEVLGCGGTIARLASERHSLSIAILSQGITSRHPERNEANSALVQELKDCSHKVGKMLGAGEVFLHDLPDNRFDTMPLLDIVKMIEDMVHRLEPDVVYTHHPGDLNNDHVLSHRAVVTAIRPEPAGPVKEIYAFEVPSSTEWAFGQFEPVFCPNVFVNISNTLSTKIEAMKLYDTEVRRFPHPRSPEALTALARYRGSTVGMEAAEAFALIRKSI